MGVIKWTARLPIRLVLILSTGTAFLLFRVAEVFLLVGETMEWLLGEGV